MIEVPKSLIYLGAPYSHRDPEVRRQRFEQVNRAAAYLMGRGLHVFSPISHSHPIAVAGGLPTGWEFWESYDTAVLSVCRDFVVLTLDGWEDSTGLQNETKIAERLAIPRHWVCPENLEAIAVFLGLARKS